MLTSPSVIVEPSALEDSGLESWRQLARSALTQNLPPGEIDFIDARSESSLPLDLSAPRNSVVNSQSLPSHVPRQFLDTAATIACHRDPQRWNLLYRLLWRLQSERKLLHIESDPDVAQFRSFAHQVNHDLHKMHAFVRFRRVEDQHGEVYIAWHRPAHRILKLATPFFAERFAIMRWTILTPDASVSWNPETHQATYASGVPREHAPQSDELEELWRSYYASIFNPARVNPGLMRSHMPVKYWQSLPEVELLPTLLSQAGSRVGYMVATQSSIVTAAPFVPAQPTLSVIRETLPSCRGCDLYRHATQVVAGKGSASAGLMLIGEQPGDQEDLHGEPFVGPAGEVLRKAMAELSIDPQAIYMTNAVKHFKFVQRGKLRIHQNPRMSEINSCRPWLEAEIDALRPRVILCLGASAAKAILGGTFALMRDRGRFLETRYSAHTIATVHPSAILRTQNKEHAADLLQLLKSDLQLARDRVFELISPIPQALKSTEILSSPNST
jgi:DNA polymerase